MPFGFNMLEYENNLYIIQRAIRESHNPIISDWVDHLRSDLVISYNGFVYFLEHIRDAEIIYESSEMKRLN